MPEFQPVLESLKNKENHDFFYQLVSELPKEVQRSVVTEIQRRHQLITDLVERFHGDKHLIFENIFGRQLGQKSDVVMHVFPYGIYFVGPNAVFAGAVDLGGFFSASGVAFTRNSVELFANRSFYKLVGFGGPDSMQHELQHLFDSMLPYNTVYDTVQVMPETKFALKEASPELLRRAYERLYWLRFNVHVRDEVAARIANKQIDNLPQEEPDNPWHSSDFVFTTYGTQVSSPVEEFEMSMSEAKKLPSEKRVLFDEVLDVSYREEMIVQEKYRSLYNRILKDIQDAIKRKENRAKVTAQILSCEDFTQFTILK